MKSILEKYFEEVLDSILQDIAANLPSHSAEYALAVENNKQLYEETADVLEGTTDIYITGGDRQALLEFIESISLKEGIETKYAYIQGYLDCVDFLKRLRIL